LVLGGVLNSTKELIEPFFDIDFYGAQIERIRVKEPSLTEHYLNSGWKLGLDPSREFSTYGYLLFHEDVLAAGINPLVHYLLFGKSENRIVIPSADFKITNLVDEESSYYSPRLYPFLSHIEHFVRVPPVLTKLFQDIYATQLGFSTKKPGTSWFDEDYYLRTNPDLANYESSAFHHFAHHGFLEGRAPSLEFEESTKAARVPREIGELRARYIFNTSPISPNIPPARPPEQANQAMGLDSGLDNFRTLLLRGSSEVVIAIGHDDYKIAVGGIQKAAEYESSFFASRNINYLYLFPAIGLLRMRDASEELSLRLNLNGTTLSGSFDLAQILTLLKTGLAGKRVVNLTMHSVYGHSKKMLIPIIHHVNAENLSWFIHDYVLKCSSPQLLLNNVTFCGDPPLGSQMCSICVHGSSRSSHVEDTREIFESFEWNVYSPSSAGRKIMMQGSNPVSVDIKVLPHGELVESKKGKFRSWKNTEPKRLRIAFVGHPSASKGWLEFLALSNSKHSEHFDFFFFGVSELDKVHNNISRVSVKSSVTAIELRTKLGLKRIDAVFSWPVWPETFHFVGFEVMEAGLPIISSHSSGNLFDSATKHGYLISYERFEDLLADEGLGSRIRNFTKENSENASLEFKFSGLTPGALASER